MLDEVFRERLLISHNADKNELKSNIRAAMLTLIALDIKILSIQYAVTLETEKE